MYNHKALICLRIHIYSNHLVLVNTFRRRHRLRWSQPVPVPVIHHQRPNRHPRHNRIIIHRFHRQCLATVRRHRPARAHRKLVGVVVVMKQMTHSSSYLNGIYSRLSRASNDLCRFGSALNLFIGCRRARSRRTHITLRDLFPLQFTSC